MSSARIYNVQFLAVLFLVTASMPLRADVCAWRNPERTMARLFAEAKDYVSIHKKLDPTTVARIEAELGQALDASEKEEFSFYPITGPQGRRLGVVMALAGKGEYGAIEVVIGVDDQGMIVGAYIQHSRERVSKALRDQAFLGQFIGKGASSELKVGQDIQTPNGAEKAGAVVVFTVKKMLLFYETLMKNKEEVIP